MLKKILRVRDKMRQKGASYVFQRARQHLSDRPSQIALDAAVACNIKCVMCSLEDWAPKGFMSMEVIDALASVLPKVPAISLSCSGEPLLHPKFEEIFIKVRRLAPKSFLEFNTNATLLTGRISECLVENELNCINVSLDGATRETFERIRSGADFSLVLENLRALKEVKLRAGASKPSLSIRFVAMKGNVSELPDVVRLSKELGAGVLYVENVDAYTEEVARERLYGKEPDQEALKIFDEARHIADELGLELELPSLSPQPAPFCISSAPVISWDGSLRPCFMRVYARPSWDVESGAEGMSKEASFGNVLEDDFWSLWRAPAYKDFRARVKSGEFTGICEDCVVSKGLLIAAPDK